MNYTKGEWRAVPVPEMNVNRIMSYAPEYYREAIADVFGINGVDEANAQLIAAAPMLYEALKELCSQYGVDEERAAYFKDPEYWQQSLKAIAKAEGRTP